MELIPLKNKKWLTVRPAIPEDAAGLIEFSKVVGKETDFLTTGEDGWQVAVEDEAEYIAAVLGDKRRCMLVGEIDGEIIGIVSIDAAGWHRLAQDAVLGIAIVKNCWHLGIGGIFMVLAKDFAKEAGYHKVGLEVRADNERAIRLYKRFGFAECGRRKEHTCVNGVYYDTLVMELIF